LEAVMVCFDNSDYTRNGDYTPSRFASQADAVQSVCDRKTGENVENSVGILCSAGDRIQVLVTPCSDLGRMRAELAKVKIGGSSDLLRGIQTAQLALKHRQNKNQKQRIIAFVGSPVTATERELEVLGKNLKKNNVSLDLVSFGETEENAAKLDKLLGAVNSGDSSHIVTVPVGPKMIIDVLISSPILSNGEEGMGGGEGGGGDDAGFEFGIDPTQDPELALALRISMEEERARQGVTAPAAPDGGAGTAPAADAAATPAETPAAPATAPLPAATDAAVIEAMDMEDMDEELRQALLLSLQEAGPMETEAAPAPAAAAVPPPAAEPAKTEPAATKDVEMPDAAAKPAEAAVSSASAPAAASDGAAIQPSWFQDPSFVSELLGGLPGVDMNDERIQQALKEVAGDGKKEEKKEEKKEDKDKK